MSLKIPFLPAATLLLAFALSSFTAHSAVRISEFMAANDGASVVDEDGDPSDWIEIVNTGDAAAALDGYALSDDADSPQKWLFPDVTLEPGAYLLVFASGKDRTDPAGELHTSFRLSRQGEYLALRDSAGEVLDVFSPSYPEQVAGVSYGLAAQAVETETFFRQATPGGPNEASLPMIVETDYAPKPVPSDEDLVITARVEATGAPIASVTLLSRVMFKAASSSEMRDDGVAPDATADDGIYSGAIKHSTLFGPLFLPGRMVRWAIVATDTDGIETRLPRFPDPVNSEEYFGLIVDDPSLDTKLPVLHRFIEDKGRAENGSGTRASLCYEGEFYDNVFIRIRGGTARSWPKKAYKIEFNDDHHFLFDPELPRVDEFNLNTTYTDKSYSRAILTTELHIDSGTPSPITFPMRVHQNAEFFSVAHFVEQPDRDFLRRNGMDPDGSLYKAGPGSTYTSGTGPFEKKTRHDEGKEDLTEFLNGLKLKDAELEGFLFDNVNIPALINFMAGVAITQNIDGSDKNHYLYRDTEGTGEWEITPWDLDLSFGPDALNTDYIIADETSAGATYPNASHPFIGSRQFPLHAGKSNELLDRLFVNGRTKRMFLRRLRTLHDRFLAGDHFDKRLDELLALMEPDTVLDRETWGSQSHFGGRRDSMRETVDRIKTEYLVPRRDYFERGGEVGIPDSQPGSVPINFGDIDVSPVSGNQDEEYIELINSNAISIDISGWRLDGAVTFTFKEGTVIPNANLFSPGINRMYVARDVTAFRQRATGPTGNQGLFLQGNYDGNLSNLGEVLVLLDRDGLEVTTLQLEGNPTPAQESLVISEFLPQPDNPDAEYVELLNIGEAAIDLAGIRFTRGVSFDFSVSAITSLDPGQRLLVVLDRDAFTEVFGSGLPVAGEFADGTRLDNSGETIKLEDTDNNTIFKFTYSVETPWPAPDVRKGHAFVLQNPESRPAGYEAESWTLSAEPGGTPGTGSGSGDPRLSDGDGDGLPALLEEALGSSDTDSSSIPVITVESAPSGITIRYPQSRTLEDVEVVIEMSLDLRLWVEADDEHLTHVSTSHIDDESDLVEQLYKLPDDQNGERIYLRLKASVR